jgi:hypothetical protein
MFSQDFAFWIQCLAWVPLDQLDSLKVVRTIRNHVNLTIECDPQAPDHSLASMVKGILDIDTDVAQATQKLKVIRNLVCLDAHYNFESTSNPSEQSKTIRNRIAYTLQGYIEIVTPTSIDSQFCKILIDDSRIVNNSSKFPECYSALTAGIRRGELKGESLEYMTQELSEYFVHVIDPHLEGDQEAMDLAHNPPVDGDFEYKPSKPSQPYFHSLGYGPGEKC